MRKHKDTPTHKITMSIARCTPERDSLTASPYTVISLRAVVQCEALGLFTECFLVSMLIMWQGTGSGADKKCVATPDKQSNCDCMTTALLYRKLKVSGYLS